MRIKYKAIVLDFDGTIVRLFNNCDINAVKIKLQKCFKKYNINFVIKNDLFDCFKVAYNNSNLVLDKETMFKEVNEIIIDLELQAVENGIAVNGFSSFVSKCVENNVKVAIVSNNSEQCIQKYIDTLNLGVEIPIVGRIPNHPEFLKPSNYMLNEMCRILQFDSNEILYIGDNIRDYYCAESQKCDFIGLTPTSRKKTNMLNAKGDLTVFNDFFEILDYLSLFT